MSSPPATKERETVVTVLRLTFKPVGSRSTIDDQILVWLEADEKPAAIHVVATPSGK
jgi:hypothetical protein